MIFLIIFLTIMVIDIITNIITVMIWGIHRRTLIMHDIIKETLDGNDIKKALAIDINMSYKNLDRSFYKFWESNLTKYVSYKNTQNQESV